MMNKDMIEWACWTAKDIDVLGKTYCCGHVRIPDEGNVTPIAKCRACKRWIGNRKEEKHGNLVHDQN